MSSWSLLDLQVRDSYCFSIDLHCYKWPQIEHFCSEYFSCVRMVCQAHKNHISIWHNLPNLSQNAIKHHYPPFSWTFTASNWNDIILTANQNNKVKSTCRQSLNIPSFSENNIVPVFFLTNLILVNTMIISSNHLMPNWILLFSLHLFSQSLTV